MKESCDVILHNLTTLNSLKSLLVLHYSAVSVTGFDESGVINNAM